MEPSRRLPRRPGVRLRGVRRPDACGGRSSPRPARPRPLPPPPPRAGEGPGPSQEPLGRPERGRQGPGRHLSQRKRQNSVTITKTRCLPQALLDETAVSAPVGASHEEELPGQESRPAARPWGRWPEAAPDGGWGSAPGRPGASRALRPDAVDTWPGAAASPQTGPRVLAARDPRGTGPQPPLRRAPCRPIGAKSLEEPLRPGSSLPDAPRPGCDLRRLRLETGPRTGTAGPESNRVCSQSTCRKARRGRRVFTVTTSGTLLRAPRCPRVAVRRLRLSECGSRTPSRHSKAGSPHDHSGTPQGPQRGARGPGGRADAGNVPIM